MSGTQGYDGYYDANSENSMSGIGDAVDDAANAIANSVADSATPPGASSNPVNVAEDLFTVRNVAIAGGGALALYLLYRHFR